MAQYQLPPDPDSKVKKAKSPREPIPWLWLGLGVLVALAGMAAGLFIIKGFLTRPPLDTAPLSPIIVVLTAPPSSTPTIAPELPTATPIPTLTPIPTPKTAVAPDEVTIDYYAAVANTDGIGVTVRGGPSVDNGIILIAPEGEVMLVIGGPAEGNDLLWWNVRLDDGTEGWAAADYLEPAALP